MNKPLNEPKVLKKLNIVDFRHLTKDKVIKMASLLDKMDSEVAKKALEQFPEFAATAKEILNDYKDTLDKSLASNSESVQAYYAACNSIISSLQGQLENETLSFDERKHIIDQMLEITKKMGEKDSENKRFIATLASIGGIVVGGVIVALASTLGSNTNIEDNEYDELE